MDRIPLIPQETIEGSIQGYLIMGITHSQRIFRPGDWPERLTGVITLFVGERRPGIHVACTRLAMPIVEEGTRCLFVSEELRLVCADAFDFVMRFASDNDLPVHTRRAQKLAASEVLGRDAPLL